MIARELTPILNVSDIPVSLAWFRELGWRTLWSWGDPPDFAAVGSGECAIFLSLDGHGGGERNDRTTAGRVDRHARTELGACLWIRVDDVDEVYRACVENDHEVIQPPTDEPWGSREMQLRHPDGYVLRIGGTPAHDHHDADHDHDHPHHH